MNLNEFKAVNEGSTEITLKDGRKLLTTNNGFRYWISSKKGIVEEVTYDYYKKSLKNRETKKSKRLKK